MRQGGREIAVPGEQDDAVVGVFESEQIGHDLDVEVALRKQAARETSRRTGGQA